MGDEKETTADRGAKLLRLFDEYERHIGQSIVERSWLFDKIWRAFLVPPQGGRDEDTGL